MTAAAFASENSIISADGVAVVVGGSRGVGLACALRLGRSGATVHIVGRDAGALESAVVVGASEGLRFVPHVCDLSSLDDVERWLATAEVNRPGSGGGIDPTEGWSHASTEEVPGRAS